MHIRLAWHHKATAAGLQVYYSAAAAAAATNTRTHTHETTTTGATAGMGCGSAPLVGAAVPAAGRAARS